jgi:hypothetical protein
MADVHLGNHRAFGGPVVNGVNHRCDEALGVLAAAMDEAGASPAVILGDLFDSPAPLPQVITRAMSVLNPRTTLLVGNHEQVSTAPGDHALGPLESVCGGVVDGPFLCSVDDADIMFVPYRPGDAVDTLPFDLEGVPGLTRRSNRPCILAMHYGIWTPDDPDYMRGAPDAVALDAVRRLASKYDIQAVFSGHWHTHRILMENPLIVQVGALVPTGWDNEGFDGYGTVIRYDPLKRTMAVKHLSGPRFMKWPWPPAAVDAFRDQGWNHIYLRVPAPMAMSREVGRWIQDLVKADKITDGEFVPDDEPARQAARDAADAARSADTLAEALAAFISAMPLDEGIDRAEILAKAREYLGGIEC